MAKGMLPRTARRIPDATIRRLPAYLRALEAEAGQRLTSAALGVLTGFSSEQVRKDLAYFGAFGTRGVGYPAQELASEIRHILGLDHELKAALFGAGHLGTALARYVAATHRDVRIVAIFDPDPQKHGTEIAGTVVESLAHFETEVQRLGVAVAILAVPDAAAQPLAQRLAAAAARQAPTWAYRFDWPSTAFDGRLKASHAMELPFVFNTWEVPGTELLTGAGADRPKLARQMHQAWVAFATRGDPNTPELPPWPAYEEERRSTMLFGSKSRVVEDPDAPDRELQEQLLMQR